MKTTEPESKDSKEQEPRAVTPQEPWPADDFPDPDFTIEGTGGPTDGSGGAYTGPPPKEK